MSKYQASGFFCTDYWYTVKLKKAQEKKANGTCKHQILDGQENLLCKNCRKILIITKRFIDDDTSSNTSSSLPLIPRTITNPTSNPIIFQNQGFYLCEVPDK